MDTRILIPIVVSVGMLVAVMVAFIMRRYKSDRLSQRFGSENDRTVVQQHGDARRAEVTATEREKHVETFPLRTLSPIDRDAYAIEWATVQRHFIEDPSAAAGTADRLVGRVMIDLGYPMSDFEQHAADISVSYPSVVQNYRAGHGIAMRLADGHATTEELRQAMICYRNLFDELLRPVGEPAKVRQIDQRRGRRLTHERAS